jgi:hypothetical protein
MLQDLSDKIIKLLGGYTHTEVSQASRFETELQEIKLEVLGLNNILLAVLDETQLLTKNFIKSELENKAHSPAMGQAIQSSGKSWRIVKSELEAQDRKRQRDNQPHFVNNGAMFNESNSKTSQSL